MTPSSKMMPEDNPPRGILWGKTPSAGAKAVYHRVDVASAARSECGKDLEPSSIFRGMVSVEHRCKNCEVLHSHG